MTLQPDPDGSLTMVLTELGPKQQHLRLTNALINGGAQPTLERVFKSDFLSAVIPSLN